ncbi:hypothetical protein C8N24_2492 [Solirubrobacter pauli]|uniref:Lysozyme inhibitor LprI N-terminal domain-containing protein n=1 Tax=Solirubrobacter pauli TaxID=166793 RepID=A0A660LFD6_9ACTN|nr:hypothetical protein [Solirubrobacter pauli]RKQ92640.1 hypothetical protein C8N24_2492 [Solirubrobacter pauli]
MRWCALVLGLIVVGCGGPDREAFVREANTACRDRAAGQEALGALPTDELLDASTKLYEQELARLKALEPPEKDRAAHARWVRANAEVVEAWRRYAADADSRAARERVLVRFDRAAELAGELGLSQCDG